MLNHKWQQRKRIMEIPTQKIIIMRITAIIALVELVIMLGFANLTFNIGTYVEVILDVAILVTLSTPMIYIWIIKPYVVARDDAMHQITHMACHDSLTQLANRHFLEEFLEKMISRFVRDKSYGALLFIDLDGFKVINDMNGHDAGDATLIEVAKRLNSTVRNEDIVSRVGGDEFVVVLSYLGTNNQLANNKALMLAERILNELNKEVNFKNTTLQIGASIGLRILAPERISSEFALKDADTAMYRAKRAGKGHVVVYC
jgi:two-component system cell cycle response regulator